MTTYQITEILNCPIERSKKWAPHLTATMEKYHINTVARQSAFIAQIGHESGRLMYVKELWGPTPAQERYEGRLDLGNTEKGDGFRFRGRGLVQTTGRKNYQLCGIALGINLIAKPELLELPEYASASAGWFWETGSGLNLGHAALEALKPHGMGVGVDLNLLADRGAFDVITKCINGGLNGYAQRVAFWKRAVDVLTEV
jgi:putative chitinase